LRVNSVLKGGFQASTDDGVIIYGASTTNPVRFQTNGVERARIDSSGRLLVGTSTAFDVRVGVTAITPQQQLAGLNQSNSTFAIACASTTDASAGWLWLAKYASGTIGTNTTAVVADERLGNITFSGSDGSNQTQAASISAAVDGTPGTNDMPGRLVFSTTADGASSPTERMRLDSSGRLGLGSSVLQAELNVFKSGAAPTVYIESDVSNNTTTSILRFGGASGRSASIQGYRGSSSNIHSLDFYTYNSGDSFGMRLTPTGLGIGTTAGTGILNAKAGTNANLVVDNLGGGGGSLRISALNDAISANTDFQLQASNLFFATGGSEKARLTSDGKLLVGTSTARSNLYNSTISSRVQIEGTSYDTSSMLLTCNSSSATADFSILNFAKSGTSSIGSNTLVTSGHYLGQIGFLGNDGTQFVSGAEIAAIVDGTSGADDMPTRLVFSTCPDSSATPVERLRITSGGSVLCGTTSTIGGDTAPLQAYGNTQTALALRGGTNNFFAAFYNTSASLIGSITGSTGSQTYYNTTSDYRLKENIVPLVGALDRIKHLKPSRFNFIVDAKKTFDGFIAHEVQIVVPEAVNGQKDAVDDDGDPIYQGIDQSKLVPLLTAALQEALQKIEDLEGRLTAAGL